MGAVVPADEAVLADAEEFCDDGTHDGAHSDVRYNKHVNDAAPADVVHQVAPADVVVRVDVVAVVRMHIFLITGTGMRICTFSYCRECKIHTL
jgi:hypothetical protein